MIFRIKKLYDILLLQLPLSALKSFAFSDSIKSFVFFILQSNFPHLTLVVLTLLVIQHLFCIFLSLYLSVLSGSSLYFQSIDFGSHQNSCFIGTSATSAIIVTLIRCSIYIFGSFFYFWMSISSQ